MKTHIKKEIFLMILKYIFRDNSKQIESENCISFYHFLLDTLEDELFEIPIDKDADISLCNSIIELLSNFDLLKEEIDFLNSQNVLKYLKNHSGLTEREFITSISKFRDMYFFIKHDFLIDF